jgi:pilus assembly protein Flp/PilA
MAWWRRERRKSPRPGRSEPTYVVERDAPSWEPPEPFDRRWARRAQVLFERLRYDAYPDHERPFEDIEPRPLPVPEPRTAPQLGHGEVYLMVIGRKHARLVPLAGASLDQLDLGQRLVQGFVLSSINDTALEVMALDEEDDKGQGLVEYALIIALIAIVAIVALMVLGGQIAAVFDEISRQIPGSSPAP